MKKSFLSFLIVGTIGFGVDLSVYFVMTQLGVEHYAARIVSIMAAMTVTWALNRRYSFTGSGKAIWLEYLHYVASSAVGAAVNYGAFLGLVTLSADRVPDAYAAVAHTAAIAVATIVALLVNYTLYKKLVFKQP